MDPVEKFLKHYGVKGMKWGVRNDKGHEGERVKIKKLDKLDKKWEAEMNRTAYMKLYNAAADKMNNGGIDKINNKPEYRDVDFTDPKNAALNDKYMAEHAKAFEDAMIAAGPSLGMNPSGTKQFVIRKNAEGEDDVFLDPVDRDKAKHAVGDTSFQVRLKTDDNGQIVSCSIEEVELKHYGVKGMKWGVRRSKDELHPPSEDASKVEEIRKKSKTSGTNSLSNAELKTAVDRMNLETQYSRLVDQTTPKSKGRKFVEGLLGDIAKEQTVRVTKAAAGLKVEQELTKRGHEDIAARIKPKKR